MYIYIYIYLIIFTNYLFNSVFLSNMDLRGLYMYFTIRRGYRPLLDLNKVFPIPDLF